MVTAGSSSLDFSLLQLLQTTGLLLLMRWDTCVLCSPLTILTKCSRGSTGMALSWLAKWSNTSTHTGSVISVGMKESSSGSQNHLERNEQNMFTEELFIQGCSLLSLTTAAGYMVLLKAGLDNINWTDEVIKYLTQVSCYRA